MAYMNQEKKKLINEALKKVVPENWKYSLRVHNHSSITMTIKSADMDLLGEIANNNSNLVNKHELKDSYFSVNHYHLEKTFSGPTLEIFKNIVNALNTNNHDNSEIMTDYFDVGHYVHLQIGSYDKPFTYTPVDNTNKKKNKIN